MILFYIVTGSLVYITQEKTDKQHRAIILIYRGTRQTITLYYSSGAAKIGGADQRVYKEGYVMIGGGV